MVLREGLLMVAAGVVPGVLIAYGAGRAMASLLAGVQPADAITMTIAVISCGAMAIAGSLFPALRAVKVDPALVMRSN
jgi:ABC-type antimicrobial peptide transport system permease subunit